MKITLDESAYSSAFLPVLESKHRYLIAFGGRGSSKTHTIIIKLILATFSTEYTKIIYVNKVFRDIREAQFSSIQKVIKDMGLSKYFTTYKGDYRFQNKLTENWIVPKGMDNSDNTKALDDPTIIWWDEITAGTQKDFFSLNDLLRTPRSKYLQFIASFNPVSEKHWVRKTFFSKDDAYKPNTEAFENIFIHHSTFLDNEFLDQKEYGKTLQVKAMVGVANLECDYYGRWGNEKKEGLFIFNYNPEKHLREVSITETEFIEISIDFNVNPMTALVFQKDMYLRWIHVVKEYRLENSDIYALCDKIRKDYDTRKILITGDASGWNRSYNSRGHKNSFDIIREELNLSASQIKTPKGKPAGYITDKRNLANAILGLHPNFKIGNCPFLIEDFENVLADSEGKINKKADASMAHLIDCFCDFLYSRCREWKYNEAA